MSWKIPTHWRDALSSHPAPRLRGIGPRLSAVALAVPEGSVAIDIGADHGLLSRALLLAGRVRFIYATDASDAALEGARKALARGIEEGRAAVLHGDGFEGTPPGEIDCAILAGTGSITALEIVRRGLASGHRPRRIVFQPSGGEHDVRTEMLNLGYGLVAEQLVAEGQRLFMVLVFEDGTGVRSLDGVTDRFVGPFISSAEGALLSAWLDGQASWLGDLVERATDPAEAAEWRERLASITELRERTGTIR
ncbi:tRNA (adenine(22)-N(1))-methyltransferase [Planctomycetes bacterium Poly30]|uniref:tRNA (Adenine(22)-N(1))-methyltransferase n=1 Tax=Saltatorellus ferox TaxID=2528018 RepID=A0A518EZB1_9BACT|nr:tRNA (adenine(22)-N(1))-methyltransferase [Planctomycetes bacterium Poly30]